jgi:tRNA C32,U32 (ribose-2'-O)-methylase TrmJ
MVSEGFDKFIASRCERIVENDKMCNELKQKISDTEKVLFKTMTRRQVAHFLEYSGIVQELNHRRSMLMLINYLPLTVK